MPYVKRDTAGNITAVSQTADGEFEEEIAENSPQLAIFLMSVAKEHSVITQSDLDFVRVVEDLVELLVEKNYILFTDLPEKAQEKMHKRQALRGKLKSSLDLWSDEEDLFL